MSLEVENLQESVPDLKKKMLIKRVPGAVPGSQSSIRKEHVCFKYFVGISAKKERKKEKCCSEESLQNI